MRRPRLLLLVLVLTACVLIVVDTGTGPDSPFAGARRVADTVLGPAARAAGAVGRLEEIGDGNSAELERLRAENARLTGDLVRGEAAALRAAELDRLLGVPGPHTRVPARVAGVGAALGFTSTVTIDVGSRDGVRAGQTVLNADGLVGRTLRVGPFTSTVLLLTDPGFTVGARLAREGSLGLASGAGKTLTYELVEGGRVQPGDSLLTTGSDTFVPDVPIGRVAMVEVGSALVTTAEVVPLADVSSLDLLAVVTEPARSSPRDPLPPPLLQPPPIPLPPPPLLPPP